MSHQKTSELERNLEIILEKSQHSTRLSFHEIVGELSGKGRYVVLILLSLLFCQPLQIPGLSTPFGLVIAFLGLRLAFGHHIWLPKKMLAKTVSSRTVEKIAKGSIKILKKLKKFIYPRISWLCRSRVFQILNGFIICFLGLFLALPFPIPLINLAPAWAMFFLTLGLLEDDGVFVVIGYGATVLCIWFLVFILVAVKNLF